MEHLMAIGIGLMVIVSAVVGITLSYVALNYTCFYICKKLNLEVDVPVYVDRLEKMRFDKIPKFCYSECHFISAVVFPLVVWAARISIVAFVCYALGRPFVV